MEHNPFVTAEAIRMYHAVLSALGKESADRLFPDVSRHLAQLDTGVRNTPFFNRDDE